MKIYITIAIVALALIVFSCDDASNDQSGFALPSQENVKGGGSSSFSNPSSGGSSGGNNSGSSLSFGNSGSGGNGGNNGGGSNGGGNVELPPDPGSEGRKTLEGIDSNNNGIRDDVEIAIYNYAPRPDQERYRAALIQLAKVMQKEMKVFSSKLDILLEVQRESNRASECIKKVSPGNGVEELRFLQKALHNTPQRERASSSFNNKIKQSGKNILASSGDPVPCDYDKK
ncbi:MAG: hypothetical protein LBQ52_09270 [Helicobacteraceae bacterium]|jgi:hypothetical protein|nr:hypothetical protein [Helicobacteraceae bacterium]